MSSDDQRKLAPAPELAAAPPPAQEEDRAPLPPLCSGEAGKEYELSVLSALIETYHNQYYVLPAGVLKNELLAALVFTDAPLSKHDVSKIHSAVEGMLAKPARVFARGDVIGVDIVMFPIAAIEEGNASAARAMLKLVEVKSADKVSASTVCGSLALQLWMHRRNVHRQWKLYAPYDDSVAPLLCSHPKFMLGDPAPTGLFEVHTGVHLKPTSDMRDVQAAFRGATLPSKGILEAMRNVRRHQDDMVFRTTAAASAFDYLVDMLNTHEACVKVAQERQEACRQRRSAKKRQIEEQYNEYYWG